LTNTVYRTESWESFYRDAEKIFPLHWKELALNQEKIKIDVDYEGYVNLEKLGRLLVVTARNDGKLCGYIIAFLMHHLHYKSAGTMALTDMYYVTPDARNGIGIALFAAFEGELKNRDVKLAMTSCKVHQDHQEVFERMGWTFSDKTFMKYLG
jgi:hypothetical protein